MRRTTITRKPYGVLLTSWDGLSIHHAWRITGPLALNAALADAQKWVRPKDRCRQRMEERAVERLQRMANEAVVGSINMSRWLKRFARAEKVWHGRHNAVTKMLADIMATKGAAK